ncbi:MAG: 4-hydroxythreonine-4-phosphate dehydrogenase PdxA [Calditrichaeota bacterium]|nr:MAG: 4-hydroxythreonine-4-phosphate dehydrogenase PdxA [Calditrichota bacterium]
MGDPAGVGPEIAVKALLHPDLYERCRPVIVGDKLTLQKAVELIAPHLKLRQLRSVAEAEFLPGIVEVLPLEEPLSEAVPPGTISPAAGRAAFHAIQRGIQLAMSGEVDALVTNPIHKEALHQAGYPFAGHTEILAHYTGAASVTMLLVHGSLRIAHVSTHVSLREACDRVKRERVLEVIRLLNQACGRFGVDRPRIAVAGLNPHASDGGLFGDEEAREIRPAVEDARREGIQAAGPISPDALFSQLKDGLYDGCVAMYHDQGHIPFKMLTFHWDAQSGSIKKMYGVNVTLGLPIVRTSVDHGTAFDIAWTGKASEEPLLEAIQVAVQLAGRSKRA